MTTQLTLRRTTCTPEATVGELYWNGEFFCYTLEDVVRPVGEAKVKGRTAIPAGKYQVLMTYSPKFQQTMPLVNNVPGFEGIRIHPGNDATDTEGCILVGQTKAQNFIGNSRAAFKQLFPRLQAAAAAGSIWITISNPPETAGVKK